MSSKKCIYKSCGNTGAGEITLFAFPKDPVRRDLWLQNAGRSGHTVQKSDCLCELHFGRQFISTNQRRKVLVGVSIPYRFDQNENDDEHIEALDECERLDINEIFGGDDDEQQDDMHSYSSNSAIEHVEHVEHVEDYTSEGIVCDPVELERSNTKRKIIEHPSQNGAKHPVKLIKIEVNKGKLKNGTDATSTLHGKDEVKPKTHTAATIIEHPDVSIFNIRGEEFIQMPKSVYLEEKTKLESSHAETYAQEIIKLREELNKYKNALQVIKNAVKSLP